MKYNKKLEKYIPLVDFISAACGDNFEVILHDTQNPTSSVISVKNGHLSGRKIGDSMTDLAIAIMHENEHTTKDFIANYEGRLKNGKVFVSSTYLIKEDDNLIGMLCINHDASPLLALSRQVNNMLEAFHIISNDDNSQYTENLDTSISNIAEAIINSTITESKIPASRMTTDEKINIIKKLESQDIFATKGTVSQVAKALKVSEPTVYRYLKLIREDSPSKP